MRLAIFGSTGFIGSAIVDEALSRGHEVAALARTTGRLEPREGLTVVTGDISDEGVVNRVVANSEAVISALGTPRRERPDPGFLADGMARVIAAMGAHGVRRLVAVSGAAITISGEAKPFPHNLISALVRVLARDAFTAKQREFEVVSASSVDWTVIRPTRVTDGPAVERPRVGTSASDIGVTVSRRTLARFMVEEAERGRYPQGAPYISD